MYDLRKECDEGMPCQQSECIAGYESQRVWMLPREDLCRG